jgi:hypothetical protein
LGRLHDGDPFRRPLLKLAIAREAHKRLPGGSSQRLLGGRLSPSQRGGGSRRKAMHLPGVRRELQLAAAARPVHSRCRPCNRSGPGNSSCHGRAGQTPPRKAAGAPGASRATIRSDRRRSSPWSASSLPAPSSRSSRAAQPSFSGVGNRGAYSGRDFMIFLICRCPFGVIMVSLEPSRPRHPTQ